MKSSLISIGLACTCASMAHAQFSPVPLTPGSFTQDIVIEKGAPPPLANFTTVTIDQGTNNYGNTFFEQGYIASLPELGLPTHGTTFVSRADVNHVYQMPPTYATNNCAFVGAQNAAGTSTLQAQVLNASLNISDPTTTYTAISLLWASGGAGNVNVTVSYADGGSEPFSFTSVDWFNTGTLATWIAAGRVQIDGSQPLNTLRTTSQTKLFSTDFSLTHTGSAITNIAFNIAGTNSFRVCVFGVSATTDGTAFNPVASVSGFNKDAVIEAGLPCPFIQGCNVTMEQGPGNGGNTWFEQGFATITGGNSPLNVGRNGLPGTGTYGLPHPGATIVSGAYTFRMPPSYAGNCCVFIGNYAAGFLTNGNFGTPAYNIGNFGMAPAAYNALSFLSSAGNGPCVIGYTVEFSDGSSEGGTISVADWFSGSTGVFVTQGRVSVDGIALNNLGTTSAGRLWHTDLTLVNKTSLITNVALAWSSGGRASLFAVSGQTASSGGAFNPITVTGYNADAIVEKEQPFFPGGLFGATTATMDQGTNNCNWTWFERGWITNGSVIASGLPPAGSTVASLNAANRIFQMPSTYTGPNGVLIDVNHQTANITPATPTAATALALLTAGGSIGSGNTMTNRCIVQHANGFNETNAFFGKDWFEAILPPAFIANGRGDTRYRIAGNVFANPQYPRLFETIFALADAVSPVTNIMVQYQTAGGTAWTTYVLAVSASAAPVAPIVGPTILSPAGTYEGSNFIAFATESGAVPFTNQWQFSADGTNWAYLTSGVGNFLNAYNVADAWGTAVLTNTGANVTNNGQYRLIVSSPAGVITNPAATLRVISPLTNVVQVADTNATSMALYLPGGAEPTAEPAAQVYLRAIDRDLSKWLNFGYNGAAPWNPSAPVGFTVKPSLGKTTVSVLRYYTANDATERDPADYTLEGSNDGGTTWTTIASGPLNLPTARNAASGAINPLTQVIQEVRFPNTQGYLMYRWSCLNVRNNATANSMQIGEIEFLGVQTRELPVILSQSGPVVKTYIGSAPTFFVNAGGFPTQYTYQWYRNNGSGAQPIAAATNSTYTLPNALLTDSGAIFSVVVWNAVGPTTGANSTLSVIARPTDPYPTAIMADGPMAFFRLDEGPDDGTGGGNNGVLAYDTWGGHNGFYTNTILQQPGFSASDPDKAAYFGQSAGSYIPVYSQPDSCVEAIGGIDFAKTNASAALSVEAWVMLDPNFPVDSVISGAGIITKGYGGGGEQFTLDLGGPRASGAAPAFRFYIRDAVAPATARIANGTAGPDVGSWHHVVGVLDQANSNVVLYVDGLRSGSGSTLTATNGLRSSSYPVVIGSRTQNANTNNNLQFYGTIDEVAIYNYALSSNQVLSHYYAAGVAPKFAIPQTINPTNIAISEGGTTNLYEPFYGSPPLIAQWYRSTDGGGTWGVLQDQTNGTLTLSSVSSTWSGYQYYLKVMNAYGTTNSAVTLLNVQFGPPQLVVDVPSSVMVYAGRTLLLQPQFAGSPPITYQWYRNGVPLANSSRISGAQSNVLAIVNVLTNDIGSYQVIAQNTILGSTTPSGTAAVWVETIPDFNTDGRGWTVQQSGGTGAARGISGDVLTMTDGNGGEALSAFYNYPLYIGSFWVGFTYQDVGGGGADGFAFVMQNDPRGASALGGAGGALGLSGITPSAALTFNIYGPNTPGIAFGVNGATGSPFRATPPVAIDLGDPIEVNMLYVNGVLSLALTDTVAHTTFTTNITADLPGLLGSNTAYVGITGADGGTVSTQTITNFFFVPLPALSAQATTTNTVLLSWPAAAGGYSLLQEGTVTSGAWVASPAAVENVGGWYQAVVPPAGKAAFYRLVLQQIEP